MGLRNILFIIATLLPCLVSSQEDSIIIIDTASVEIFNNKTNEYEIWGYINIINNTDEEYITWITKNSVADRTNDQKITDYFFHHKPHYDFSLFNLMCENIVFEGGWRPIIDYSLLKNILPGREFTYMFIKTDTNMDLYKDRVVLLKRKDVEEFLKFEIQDYFLFPQSSIVIDME
ncbi:MAG: hypothetical protein J5709_10325 [Bacteroidales bacterium]|nr:hypothetical protein [Bacteroidales bacterium]